MEHMKYMEKCVGDKNQTENTVFPCYSGVWEQNIFPLGKFAKKKASKS